MSRYWLANGTVPERCPGKATVFGTLGAAAATPANPTPAAVNAVAAATAKPNLLMLNPLGYPLGQMP